MTKIIIFAGAGASKAVNGDRFPTTVQFFERLPEDITSDPLFQLVVDYLLRANPKRVVDIEEILWELEILRSFCSDFQARSSLIGYGLASGRLASISPQNKNFGSLAETLSNTLHLSQSLVGRINAAVYEFYSYEPEESELDGNWLYLLDKLEKVKADYRIFTTNYDTAIEGAVVARGKPSLDDFSGLSGKVTKRLDLDRWKSLKSKTPILTKLHGSINWKFSGDQIKVGDDVYTGDHKKHAIIYPGFKGTSDSPFFSPLHSYLGDRLEEADAVIFVGFAFRDDYINDMIADRVASGTSVYSINPAQELVFPVRRLHAKMFKEGFDRKSIDAVFKDMSTKSILKLI